MDSQELAIEYLKLLRSEIELRIKTQTTLTIGKITACGALFSYLIKNDLPASLIVIPLVALSLDLFMAHNVSLINGIANYIKKEIEEKVFTPIALDWGLYENTFSQTSPSRTRDLLERLGQIGITLLFFIVSLIGAYQYLGFSKELFLWAAIIPFLIIDGYIQVKVRASF